MTLHTNSILDALPFYYKKVPHHSCWNQPAETTFKQINGGKRETEQDNIETSYRLTVPKNGYLQSWNTLISRNTLYITMMIKKTKQKQKQHIKANIKVRNEHSL